MLLGAILPTGTLPCSYPLCFYSAYDSYFLQSSAACPFPESPLGIPRFRGIFSFFYCWFCHAFSRHNHIAHNPGL